MTNNDRLKSLQEEALALHEQWRGKLSIESKVPVADKHALSIAYTPGVAEPCRRIAADPGLVDLYTGRWNTVAVVSDGSAVLGLGNIGARAAMPVMEGKSVLFKAFGAVDAFPICIDSQDPDDIVRTVKLLEPSFGGINLEDISAPNCFEVERRLIEECDIPVFHDDQHGTAVVVIAAAINSCKVTGRALTDLKVVMTGAGAVHDDLQISERPAGDLAGIDGRRDNHYCCTMLVVVKNRYVTFLDKAPLHLEAVGRRDVFQIDAAETGFQQLHRAYDVVRVLTVDADRKGVDSPESLEQDRLALHDRHGGTGSDVAQAQYRGAVADYCHRVPAAGVE